MNLYHLAIFISSFSFFVYGILYFTSPHMKSEFKRFNLERLGLLTIILEFLGAAGLIAGLMFKPLLVISSGGLALLMLLGLIVRLRLKDSLWISLPALFYMVLNAYILFKSI